MGQALTKDALSFTEIAIVMGISVSAVKFAHEEALRKLRLWYAVDPRLRDALMNDPPGMEEDFVEPLG